jgi:hypothetical protein
MQLLRYRSNDMVTSMINNKITSSNASLSEVGNTRYKSEHSLMERVCACNTGNSTVLLQFTWHATM